MDVKIRVWILLVKGQGKVILDIKGPGKIMDIYLTLLVSADICHGKRMLISLKFICSCVTIFFFSACIYTWWSIACIYTHQNRYFCSFFIKNMFV